MKSDGPDRGERSDRPNVKGSVGRPIEIRRSRSSETFGPSELCSDRAAKTRGPNGPFNPGHPCVRSFVSKSFERFREAVVPQFSIGCVLRVLNSHGKW